MKLSAPALAFPHDEGGSMTGIRPGAGHVTPDDMHREFGERWDIVPITGGYRAVIRETGGYTPIPRYGRTPGELAESIRIVEH